MGTAVVVFLYWVASIPSLLFTCRPIAYNWDPSIDGTCGNLKALEISSGVFNMLVDVWVVFLPLPVIWKLQMSRQKKWAVTASFALGLM